MVIDNLPVINSEQLYEKYGVYVREYLRGNPNKTFIGFQIIDETKGTDDKFNVNMVFENKGIELNFKHEIKTA